jgi:hypothetical protein
MSGYAELAVTTNFSFLRGASHGAELVQRAAELGLSAIGVADRNTLAGVVRAHVAAKEARLKLLVGARLVPLEGPEILAYPMDRTAYGRLSRLLSDGKMKPDVPKGECHLTLENILAASEGQVLIVMPPAVPPAAFADTLRKIAAAAPGRTWLAARYTYSGRNRERIARLEELAASANVPLLATNDVHFHHPARKRLAGRDGLHPRRRAPLTRRATCWKPHAEGAPERPGRNGAAVPRSPASHDPHQCDRRSLHLLAGRVEIRISGRAGAKGHHAAKAPDEALTWAGAGSAIPKACRTRCAPTWSRNWR